MPASFFFWKYVDGHAWVIDGYLRALEQSSGKRRLLLHCNFGWGGVADGYYIDGVFNTTDGSVIDDETDAAHADRHAYNLRYKTEIAFVGY